MSPYFAAIVGAVWVSVAPADMTKQLHEEIRHTGTPGAVQPPEWRKSKPVESCPIYGDGQVIGFSLGCKQDRRAADGLQIRY